jgi:hypothetical protein
MRIRSFALALGLCLIGGLSFAGNVIMPADFTGLQQNMTPQEFQDAGLNKLTPDELAALNAWLTSKMKQREAAVATAPRVERGGFLQPGDSGPVQSRILGEFHGWRGHTHFALENGQVWVQADDSELEGVNITDPEVTITEGLMGDWKLKVKGYNSFVKVKRVK